MSGSTVYAGVKPIKENQIRYDDNAGIKRSSVNCMADPGRAIRPMASEI